MTKVLHCGDLMPGCSFEARGNSEEEVMAQAAEHAKSAHGLGQISEDMEMQVRGAIHEEEDEGEEQAEEVLVVESADGSAPAEGTGAISEEPPAAVSEADGEATGEEATQPTLSEVLAMGESTEERADDEKEEGRAQAAGA